MIKHYLNIALRNIRKYKAQTVISVCAMAVSMTLLAMLTSFVTQLMQGVPMLDTPYAHRIGQLQEESASISSEDLNLVLGHQFESIEALHYTVNNRYTVMATANPGTSSERSMLVSAGNSDPEYFSFIGEKSAVTYDSLPAFAANEVIISRPIADKLYGSGVNPIGSPINLHFYSYDGAEFDKNYTVRDVLRDQGPLGHYLNNDLEIFFSDDHVPSYGRYFVLFLLRNGYTFDDFNKELQAISNQRLYAFSVNELYGPATAETNRIKHGIILFLFLFVCVSFASYLRQECQLFRLREREVAIRTCCGGKPANLFVLFFTEVLIVLLLTLALSIVLNYLCDVIVTTYFGVYIDEMNWTISGTMLPSIVTTAVLVAISALAIALTVRRIRLDQTGLAMRMKPAPKHRLRNVGITIQLIVSLVFTWLIVILYTSIDHIKEVNNMSDDIDYERYLLVRANGSTEAELNETYNLIERVEPIDHIYRFYSFMTLYNAVGEEGSDITLTMYYQKYNDFEDMQRMEINELPDFNPDFCILVSEGFKKYLVDNNVWNGKSVKINGKDYDLRGTYDEVPHDAIRTSRSVIINDSGDDNSIPYDRVIVAKPGREKDVIEAIDDVLHKVFPSRIDIGTRLYFENLKLKFELLTSAFTVIYILAIVSIITTVSTIYASVSLDTRRRRKEMALRKLNGATSKVIAKLFLRTYIVTVIIAMLIAFTTGYLFASTGVFEANDLHHSFGSLVGTFAVALVVIVATTALTIAWKIRQIMRVDPIEYLKD